MIKELSTDIRGYGVNASAGMCGITVRMGALGLVVPA